MDYVFRPLISFQMSVASTGALLMPEYALYIRSRRMRLLDKVDICPFLQPPLYFLIQLHRREEYVADGNTVVRKYWQVIERQW